MDETACPAGLGGQRRRSAEWTGLDLDRPGVAPYNDTPSRWSRGSPEARWTHADDLDLLTARPAARASPPASGAALLPRTLAERSVAARATTPTSSPRPAPSVRSGDGSAPRAERRRETRRGRGTGVVGIASARRSRLPRARHLRSPPVLYVRGTSPAERGGRASRWWAPGPRPPPGGRSPAAMARDLAAAGLAIVSGLARGIDTAAHQGALDGQGPNGGRARARPSTGCTRRRTRSWPRAGGRAGAPWSPSSRSGTRPRPRPLSRGATA